jgi:hypothetical protein
MKFISNIIDALRRRGTATQRSALARQDEHVSDHTVLERSRKIVRTSEGNVEGFVATIAPYEEVVTPLTADELAPILDHARLAIDFVAKYAGLREPEISIATLDAAFTAWSNDGDRDEDPDEAVIELLGACFGEFCNQRLGMQWVKITDKQGTCIAIDGIAYQFRGFPYHSVSKRIEAREVGFFHGVYTLMQDMARESTPRDSSPTA